jgi:hypothetical protein
MIKIGEIEIPINYFELSKEEKDYLIEQLYNMFIQTIEGRINPAFETKEIMKSILQSSIISNRKDENYEICQILIDIEKRLDENRD